MLCYPVQLTSIGEMRLLNDAMIKAGMPIDEINIVRQSVSLIKGGRFSRYAFPAQVVSLIISDVPGDTLSVIGSGPTVFQRNPHAKTLELLDKYGLRDIISPKLLTYIFENCDKTPTRHPNNTTNHLICNNIYCLQKAAKVASSLGYSVEILKKQLNEPVNDAAVFLKNQCDNTSKKMKRNDKVCLLSGGESTVTVTGKGTGGRNTELALRFAQLINNSDIDITLLSCGSDGSDGNSDAAGAVVNRDTVKKGMALGFDGQKYLQNNDSYTYFKNTGELIITGKTGTNVMDFQIILIN